MNEIQIEWDFRVIAAGFVPGYTAPTLPVQRPNDIEIKGKLSSHNNFEPNFPTTISTTSITEVENYFAKYEDGLGQEKCEGNSPAST